MKRSTIRHFLKLANQPDMISFAGGLPAQELLPTDELTDCVARVVQQHGSSALQYGATEGVTELRDCIAQRHSSEGRPVGRDNVLIVSGAQQALDMVGRIFLDKDDVVALENPTYLAALLAWRPLGVTFAAAPGDPKGMDIAHLSAALARRPKFLYLVPNFQNPQGTTLALERRQQLAQFVAQENVPMVEDDPYGQLRFEGTDLPSVFSMQENPASGNIVHLGTFSKVIAPGLRVGWIVAPAAVVEKLLLVKQAMDLHTSTLNQYLVLEWLRSGHHESRLAKIRESYRARRDAMLTALADHFPAEATWSRPEGGMFVFVRLPETIDTAGLLPSAVEQRVIFVPGADFHVDGSGQNTMRLNFTRHQPAEIHEGIRRLGSIVKAAMQGGK